MPNVMAVMFGVVLLSNTCLSLTNSVFDGAPRTEVDIQTRSGALLGEPATTANKSKVLYGIAKDPDLMSQLVEMEEEREEGQDEDKPKVGVPPLVPIV